MTLVVFVVLAYVTSKIVERPYIPVKALSIEYGTDYSRAKRAGFGVGMEIANMSVYSTAVATWCDGSWEGSYYDWDVKRNPDQDHPPSMRRYQMLHISYRGGKPSYAFNKYEIDWVTNNYPGSYWIIANEPENEHQGNMTPEQYAHEYAYWSAYIKRRDATARIVLGGVTAPTPLRIKWLNQFREHYASHHRGAFPDPEMYNTHLYIMPETGEGGWPIGIPVGLTDTVGEEYPYSEHLSVTLFNELVSNYAAWMNEIGARGSNDDSRPLIVTEYGHIGVYGEAEVIRFMTETFDSLWTTTGWITETGYYSDTSGLPPGQGRVVQEWQWFALNAPHVVDGQLGRLFLTTPVTATVAPYTVTWYITQTNIGKVFQAEIETRRAN